MLYEVQLFISHTENTQCSISSNQVHDTFVFIVTVLN